MKRAVLREYDPRDECWKVKGEVKIKEETPLSVKVKIGFFSQYQWYPKKGMVYRFEEIKEGVPR